MTAKIKFYSLLCFLTAFLVSAVCFLPFCGNFANAQESNLNNVICTPQDNFDNSAYGNEDCNFVYAPNNGAASQINNAVRITFVYNGRTFVYDQSKIIYDKFDHDTVATLMQRGFFEDAAGKSAIIKKVQTFGFDTATAVNYVLTGLDKVISQIDAEVSYKQIDSAVTFKPNSQNIFSISQGKDGLKVDVGKLYDEIKQNLGKGNFSLQVPTNRVKAVTAQENKNKTVLKASFTTTYANSSADRKSNVKTALMKFNGKIVQPDETVSFNDTVGARTEKNGYKNAKIIVNGKYVDGIGGGVCQASTTIYNAVLTAGLKIEEWHRHTLKSSYVKPSFDAMVNSNGADLVFVNDTASPIYIRTLCDDTSASVFVYGVPNEYEIERKYKVVKKNPAKINTIVDTDGKYADKVTYDDERVYLQNPIDGLTTEGYLIFKKNGKVIEEKLIRRDTYQSVEGILVQGSQPRPIPLPDDVPIEEFEGIS